MFIEGLGKYTRDKRLLFPLLLGVIYTQIPLLNGLGYEAAALTGVYIHLRILFGCRASGQVPDWKKQFTRNYWFYLQEVIIIALILTFNSIFVPKCDWNTGAWFWGVIPPVTIWISLAIVDFGLCVTPKWGWWVARALSIGNITLFLTSLAIYPPIAGFSWSFGWFAGSIYDEALSFSLAVFLYRSSVFLQGLILLFFVQFQIDKSRFLFRKSVVISFFTCLSIYSCYFSQRQNFDIDHNQVSVQAELGSRLETEHFIVYFDAKNIDFKEQIWLERDLEFRYWELKKFFNEDPVVWRGRKIEVFIYPNRKVQQRLMGSRHTLVARPWTHQMHIRWEFGEDVVAHELAHLFTAPFGNPVTQLSMQAGVWPNLGLIEGVAVAADWGATETNAHEISATLVEIGKAPNLLEIISPQNFWRQPAGKAYQMMGSFTAWLIAEYGIENFKKVYANSDFDTVYGKSIQELHDEWFGFIQKIPVSSDMKQMTLFRYDKPTIFEKVCARAIAEERRLVNNFLEVGDLQSAREHLDKMLKWEPNNWRHHYSLVDLLLREEREAEAESIVQNQLQKEYSLSEESYLQEKLADIWWRQGKREEAREIYQKLQSQGLSYAVKRKLAIKEYFTENPSHFGFEKEYFFDRPSLIKRIWLMEQLSKESILGHYLLNFNFFYAKEFELITPIENELPAPVRSMSWKIELKSAWRAGESEQVKKLIRHPIALQGNDNRVLAAEYEERIIFIEQRD